MTMVNNSPAARSARMQSLLCSQIIPIEGEDLVAFAGIILPYTDLFVLLIWCLTGVRLQMYRWWEKNRYTYIECLNPDVNWPLVKRADDWLLELIKIIYPIIHDLSDQEKLDIVNDIPMKAFHPTQSIATIQE